MTEPETAIPQEQHSAAAHGSETAEQWPTLLGRMLEDLARVVQLELQLLEARMGRSLTGLADRAIAALIILYAGVIAGCCLLAALILLLHGWMQWWQCFAVGGLVTIVCGIVAYMSVKTSLPPGESEERSGARISLSEGAGPER